MRKHAFEDDGDGDCKHCPLPETNRNVHAAPPDPVKQATTGFRHGETYDVKVDYDRLNAQARRVYDCMADHGWRSLREIAEVTGDPEASVSARLRDFRKPEFGGMKVERRRRDDAGLWEYRCPDIPPPPNGTAE